MSLLSIPNNFTAYTKIQSSLVNANFTAIASLINGALDNSNIAAAAGIAYSKLTLTGSVVNSDISATAAIAYSKLALTGGVVNSDINAAAAIAYSKLALSNSVVNSDISATAAIAWSKMAALGNTQVVTTTSGGVLQSLASLPVSLGGTGQTSFSAGVLKSNGTVISSSSIVDSDISATAAIALTKLAQGGAALTQSLVWNGTAWTPGSAGAGVGAKNYIPNYNFETNSVANWSLANTAISTANGYPVPTSTAAAGTPLDSTHGGTAAAGTLSFTPVSTGKLAGTYSGSLASSGATTAGDVLLSSACTIDIEDQAKMLAFKFAYKLSVDPGATNRNFSGTSLNTWAVWIYNVTSGSWIQPQGVYNLTQSSGVGIASGTFQTPSDMTQFQLALVNINATGAAVTLLLDDFSVGPQSLVYGPAMTDWQSYTPTITGIPTSSTSAFWRREGDSAEIRVRLTASGVSTGTITVSLPSGLTIDTTKITGTSATSSNFGNAQSQPSTSVPGEYYTGTVVYSSTTAVSVVDDNTSSGNFWGSAVPIAWASAGTATLRFKVPISGWSSNSQMSSDTDTRVVAANYSSNSTTALPSTGDVLIQFNTLNYDTHAAVTTGASWSYRAPAPGYYTFKLNLRGTPSAAQTLFITPYVNGIGRSNYGLTTPYFSSTAANQAATSNGDIYLNAGDLLDMRASTNTGTFTLSGSVGQNWINISRLSGPSAIAASESVNGRYYSSSTAISGSYAAVTYGTKDYDSHSAYSAGTLTIPISGKYQFNASVITSATFALNNITEIALFKSGTQMNEAYEIAGGSNTSMMAQISDQISCLAGDTIQVKVLSTGTTPTIGASNFRNYFTWARVGN